MALGDDVYSDAASVGRIFVYIRVLIGALVALLSFSIGLYIILHKNEETDLVSARVQEDVACTDLPCVVDVRYTYKDMPYESTIKGNEYTTYTQNSVIPLYVKKIPPGSDPSLEGPVPKWVGWGMVTGSILGVVVLFWWFWMTRKYKIVAAAEGTSDLLNFVSGGKI